LRIARYQKSQEKAESDISEARDLADRQLMRKAQQKLKEAKIEIGNLEKEIQALEADIQKEDKEALPIYDRLKTKDHPVKAAQEEAKKIKINSLLKSAKGFEKLKEEHERAKSEVAALRQQIGYGASSEKPAGGLVDDNKSRNVEAPKPEAVRAQSPALVTSGELSPRGARVEVLVSMPDQSPQRLAFEDKSYESFKSLCQSALQLTGFNFNIVHVNPEGGETEITNDSDFKRALNAPGTARFKVQNVKSIDDAA